jgi:hypothetical protein
MNTHIHNVADKNAGYYDLGVLQKLLGILVLKSTVRHP